MKLLSNEKNHNRWRKGIRWNPILSYDVLLIRLSPRSRSSHKRSSIVSVNSILSRKSRFIKKKRSIISLHKKVSRFDDYAFPSIYYFYTYISQRELFTIKWPVTSFHLTLQRIETFRLEKKKKKKEDFETLRAYVIRDQRIQRDVDFSLYILSVVSLFATPLPSIPYPTASTRNIKGKTGTRQELAINLIRSSLCVGSSTIIFTASTNSRL